MVKKTHGGFIDPEVLADLVTETVPNKLVFSALAEIDNTLEGRAGSEITYPVYNYIGKAEDVAPGEAIPLSRITSGTKTAKIKKAGKGVEIFDEDEVSGLGNPIDIAADQIATSIADKVNSDVLTALKGAIQTSAPVNSVETLQAALDIFADEDNAKYVIFLNPKDAAKLRTDAGQTFLSGTALGAERFANGVYGDVLGVQIIRSRSVDEGDFYLVKEGAVKLITKRRAIIEDDRVASKGKTDIYGNIHYTAFLFKPNNVVKAGAGEPGE